MSASTERKNRAAAREAGTDKKTNARQEAEKKAEKSRRQWTIGTVLVAILLVVIILLNTGFLYKHTTAYSVGDRKYSPAEMNYAFVTQYISFVNQYGSYASLFGLDTSQGVSGLKTQECAMLGEGQTWRDYFLQNAENELQQIAALAGYAGANGIELDESEIAELEDGLTSLDEAAKSYGYSNVNRFLAAQYGTGVNRNVVLALSKESALANKAAQAFTDSQVYSDEELEEHYASFLGSRDYFDYATYFVAAETVPAEGEGEDAEANAAPNDQTMLEARMTAKAIEMAYQDGYDIEDYVERLNAAIEAENDAGSATERSRVAGSSLGDLSDWLLDDSRTAGDLGVVEASDGTGYNVVLFLARDDNHYPTVSVRHILIQAVASEDGTYSDEAKQAALEKINQIRDEFEATDKSEEIFAELANKYSEDGGSNTNGGLYENIYKGQMVSEFDSFCFAGHKSGDTAVVYGESSGYAGYHLIYFVGEGDAYSSKIARDDLLDTAADEFLSDLIGELESGERHWIKLVG